MRAFATRRRGRAFASLLLATALTGCIGMTQQRIAPGEEPILVGPAVRDNRTPMDPAFACFGARLSTVRPRRLVVAVGDVRDFTGKYSVNEGTAITQGGALMVASALGKLAGPIVLAERFDPTIGERELAYTDRRQLGDGSAHAVAGATGASNVPWLPYYGGSITASDYYIVGGITELNYNIRSGGAEVRVGQLGPKTRTYTQSVAIDLRIVDTRSLLVVSTVSLTKQFTGYEVGFNSFRFFDSNLFDINVGAKGQEPLQLGIRAALEEATLRLVAAVARVDAAPCLSLRSWDGNATASTAAHAAPGVANSAKAVASASAAFDAIPVSTGAAGAFQVPFEPGSPEIGGSSAADIERIAAAAVAGPVELTLVGRESETPDPAKRDALTDRRVATLVAALGARGVARSSIAVVWRPAVSDPAGHRSGPGLQDLARLRIGP